MSANILNAEQMVDTYTPNLPARQRQANIDYLKKILMLLSDGSLYVWRDIGRSFQKSGSGFIEV